MTAIAQALKDAGFVTRQSEAYALAAKLLHLYNKDIGAVIALLRRVLADMDANIKLAGVRRNGDGFARLISHDEVLRLGLVALHQQLEEPIGAETFELEAALGIGPCRGKHVKELLRLGLRVEEYFRQPCDIEWALSQGQFYLLQARAIKGAGGESGPASVPADERERIRQEEVAALAARAEPGGTVWSRYNLARCGLQFFYRVTLGQDQRFEKLPCGRAPRR